MLISPNHSYLVRAVLSLPLLLSSVCWGATGNALIVNDGTGGLEANVTTNLSNKLILAGYTVTTNVGVPGGSLSGFQQIWDIRYSNATALTGGDITAYVAFMAGGGSLFVMGENTGFITRNNSIISLVSSAGGGTITVTTPNNNQTIQTPFTGPNAVSSISFLAAAGVAAPQRGAFITKDGSGIGAGIVYSPGAMTNAPAGSLLIVFDVNFLDLSADANSQALSNNMIAYLAAPTPIQSVPAPSSLLLLGVGFVGFAAFEMRRRRRGSA